MVRVASDNSVDKNTIVLVTANAALFPEEAVIRLARRKWTITKRSKRIREALQALRDGVANVLLIHDTPELPASFVLRAQIADPLAILCPTIIAGHQAHQDEHHLLRRMGEPELVEDMSKPALFVHSFEQLMRKWGQASFVKLQQVSRQYSEKDQIAFVKALTTLRAESGIENLVTASLARAIPLQGNLKSLETLLLGALKESPRNLTIIFSLIEFYLRASMPETCLKIFTAASKTFSNRRILIPDQIQAHLMLNQVSETIPLLRELVDENYARNTSQSFLARCLYAEGHMDSFQKVIENQSSITDDFKNSWNKVAG